jgi:hypothetical protein
VTTTYHENLGVEEDEEDHGQDPGHQEPTVSNSTLISMGSKLNEYWKVWPALFCKNIAIQRGTKSL